MTIYQEKFKGIDPNKIRWVRHAIILPETRRVNLDFLETAVKVEEEMYKTLKDIYNFRLINDKFIYDFKSDAVIGKKLHTKLSNTPIFLLSKDWIKQEIYRTGSPMLRKFIENNLMLCDIMADYLQYVKNRHEEAMKYWKLVTKYHVMADEEKEEDESDKNK